MSGDRLSDVLVAAPGVNLGEEGEGAVYAYLGAPGGPSTRPAWIAESDQRDAKLGTSAAPAGDVNRDSFADVVMGAPEYDPPLDSVAAGRNPAFGRVYLQFGWGPSEIIIKKVPAFEAEELEAHSYVNWPVGDIADLFRNQGDDPEVKLLYRALLDEFEAALESPQRVDAIDEISTLREAFPVDVWNRYFGLYQLFRRGDSNVDRRLVISDGIFTLNALFAGGTLGCEDAADTNDDGVVDISDPIALFGYLFTSTSPEPPYPRDELGLDPTADRLECAGY